VKGDSLLVDDGGGRFSTKRMRSLMKRAQQDAGLEATGNIHLLRHSFCTHLAMAGKPPTVIQELAGHKHLTTTALRARSERREGGRHRGAEPALPTGIAPANPAAPAVGLGRILEARLTK
jgi:integrase